MRSGASYWGGTLELTDGNDEEEDEKRRKIGEVDRAALISHHDYNKTQQSWLMYPESSIKGNNKQKVDLGCLVCSRNAFKWTLISIGIAILIISLSIIIVKVIPKHKPHPTPPDNYTRALNKALLFFNAQKSGKLGKKNGVPWRGDSGLQDGNDTVFKWGLVGGYYDAGDNIKFNFPMSYAMTMLSWSVIEYSHKYKTIGEYNHVLDLIKHGTDYLLLTFNSSATKIDQIYAQVGASLNDSATPDDHRCWERPEDMDYMRPSISINAGPDLAGEMAAALASASIVFRGSNEAYSNKLARGAETLFAFAREQGRRRPYSRGNQLIEHFYNSSGYYDEYMWSGAWLYYATGNKTYLSLATNPGIPKNSKAFFGIPDLSVPSWDNKLPAAMLLLTRYRIFLSPGYPYEDMLRMYHNVTTLNMCSYLRQFQVFNWTKGGLIQLNHGRPQPLQYAANAAFLASLFVDYLNATDVPGFNCGPNFISLAHLRKFSTSQVDYILGKNPMKMSYVVGYGAKFPRRVHHRGASIPNNKIKYSCKGGWKWKDSHKPNPNNVTGAMVGGPDRFDKFIDSRNNYSYTEPTLVGNAALVAALVSLTTTGHNYGIDKNTIFSAVPPLYPQASPPPPPWKP
ncbi:Endoglucanase 7 [Linum perenne]